MALWWCAEWCDDGAVVVVHGVMEMDCSATIVVFGSVALVYGDMCCADIVDIAGYCDRG